MKMRSGWIVLALLVTISGCKPERPKIEGVWYGQNGLTVIFNTDGTFSQSGIKPFAGKWRAEDGHYIVSIDKINGKPITDAVEGVAADNWTYSSTSASSKIAGILSRIEFTISDEGTSLMQKVKGMEPAIYSRAKPANP